MLREILTEDIHDRNQLFSVYMKDRINDWVATHRLPKTSAYMFAADYRRCAGPKSLTAIVPDGEDPRPYLALVEAFA